MLLQQEWWDDGEDDHGWNGLCMRIYELRIPIAVASCGAC